MKTKLMTLFLVTIFSGLSLKAADAPVHVPTKAIEKVLNQVSQGTNRLCEQGNAFGLKFSIRSFKGLPCKNPIIGSIAELACTKDNIDDYLNSGCHKNAVTALAAVGNDVTPEKYLLEKSGPIGRKIIGMLCIFLSNVDALTSICEQVDE